MKLTNLRQLYYSCKDLEMARQLFKFNFKGKVVHVLYLTDMTPHKLGLYFPDTKHRLVLNVEKGFTVNEYLGEDYKVLVKGLALPYEPSTPLKPQQFFQELNGAIPSASKKYRVPKSYEIVDFMPLENDNSIYFKCWRTLNKEINEVSEDNLNKTRLLLGEYYYQHCKLHNIASTWTSKSHYKNTDISFEIV